MRRLLLCAADPQLSIAEQSRQWLAWLMAGEEEPPPATASERNSAEMIRYLILFSFLSYVSLSFC